MHLVRHTVNTHGDLAVSERIKPAGQRWGLFLALFLRSSLFFPWSWRATATQRAQRSAIHVHCINIPSQGSPRNKTPRNPVQFSYMEDNGSSAPARPRLNLKPRDPDAAARFEAERQQALAKVRWLGVERRDHRAPQI